MKRTVSRPVGYALSLAVGLSGSAALADSAGEVGCARYYPTIYLVADQRPSVDVVDVFLSDACPGRVHRWTGVERLTAETIQQVGAAALASLRPVCVALNTRCTGTWATDPDCVRIAPVAVAPIRFETCPPRELPMTVATRQSPATVLRVPQTDADGNVRRCIKPAARRDDLGRHYIVGARLSGCSASLEYPAGRGQIQPTTTTFGGTALLFNDGFFDTKSFALPHVVSRLQGTVDASGNVVGMGFPLEDLLRHWTYAYRLTIDLPPEPPRIEP